MSCHHGSKISGSQQQGALVTTPARATKTEKKNRFTINKTTNLHTKHKNFLFFFLNFDTDLSDSTPEKFANI